LVYFSRHRHVRQWREYLERKVGWFSLAHNLLKKAAIDQKAEITMQGYDHPAPLFLCFSYDFSSSELSP